MPVDIERLLSDALAEIKSEKSRDELDERFQRLEDRKPDFTLRDIIHALEGASEDELEALRGTVLGPAAREAERRQEDNNGDSSGDSSGTKPPPKPRRTRPGRKSGAAYDWWVDDDGRVTRLDVARVYTGEDEPEQVDLPEDEGGNDAD